MMKLYEFIASYIEEHGRAPGYKQMAFATGHSHSKIFDLINDLVHAGLIRKAPCQRYSLRLVHKEERQNA